MTRSTFLGSIFDLKYSIIAENPYNRAQDSYLQHGSSEDKLYDKKSQYFDPESS